MRTPLVVLVFALVLFTLPFRGWSGEESVTAPARAVRLTLRDGSSQLVRLDGVGCEKSLCSRVAINGGIQGRIQLDRLDAIRGVCDGHAQFVFSDGTEQGVTVIPDNRVLYVTGADGRARKIHLDALKSVQFRSRESR